VLAAAVDQDQGVVRAHAAHGDRALAGLVAGLADVHALQVAHGVQQGDVGTAGQVLAGDHADAGRRVGDLLLEAGRGDDHGVQGGGIAGRGRSRGRGGHGHGGGQGGAEGQGEEGGAGQVWLQGHGVLACAEWKAHAWAQAGGPAHAWVCRGRTEGGARAAARADQAAGGGAWPGCRRRAGSSGRARLGPDWSWRGAATRETARPDHGEASATAVATPCCDGRGRGFFAAARRWSVPPGLPESSLAATTCTGAWSEAAGTPAASRRTTRWEETRASTSSAATASAATTAPPALPGADEAAPVGWNSAGWRNWFTHPLGTRRFGRPGDIKREWFSNTTDSCLDHVSAHCRSRLW